MLHSPSQTGIRPKSRILIIDDLPKWRDEALKVPLEPLDHTIVTAPDRTKGLVELSGRSFQLVVLNVELEGSIPEEQIVPQWVELMDLARKRGTQVIVVSAKEHGATITVTMLMRIAFKDYSVVDFFVKEDFSPNEYVDEVRKAVERHQTPDLPLPHGTRQEFVSRLAGRAEWIPGETARRAFLVDAGLDSGFVYALSLSGSPSASAEQFFKVVDSIGWLVSPAQYCPLGRIAKHMFDHAVTVGERDFVAQLVLCHRLATDLECLDEMCEYLHHRGL